MLGLVLAGCEFGLVAAGGDLELVEVVGDWCVLVVGGLVVGFDGFGSVIGGFGVGFVGITGPGLFDIGPRSTTGMYLRRN